MDIYTPWIRHCSNSEHHNHGNQVYVYVAQVVYKKQVISDEYMLYTSHTACDVKLITSGSMGRCACMHSIVTFYAE